MWHMRQVLNKKNERKNPKMPNLYELFRLPH